DWSSDGALPIFRPSARTTKARPPLLAAIWNRLRPYRAFEPLDCRYPEALPPDAASPECLHEPGRSSRAAAPQPRRAGTPRSPPSNMSRLSSGLLAGSSGRDRLPQRLQSACQEADRSVDPAPTKQGFTEARAPLRHGIRFNDAMRDKELRLALVFFGGVSLAVYMHGVSKEILKLARASRALHGIADRSIRSAARAEDFIAADDPEHDTELV